MRAAFRVAQEMGARLGRSSLLQRTLPPRQAVDLAARAGTAMLCPTIVTN